MEKEVVKKAVARPCVKKAAEVILAVAEQLAPPAPKVRDFTEAKAKWVLGTEVERLWAERATPDEFVESVCGSIGGKSVEDVIASNATA